MGSPDAPPREARSGERGFFPATHWTEIATARGTDEGAATLALENLCRTYLPAIENYLRWFRHPPGEPHELANEFLAHFIHHDSLRRVDPARGRFRSYLLGALKLFLCSKWRADARVPVHLELDEAAADSIPDAGAAADFDRRFAEILVGTAVRRMKERFAGSRIESQIPALLPFLGADPPTESLREVAARLGVSDDLVYQNLRRLREELSRQLRRETLRHVGPDDDVEEEMQALLRTFARG